MDVGFVKSRALGVCLAALCSGAFAMGGDDAVDRLKTLQQGAIAHKDESLPRAYHFGSQGPGKRFSNHASHTNRLIPVYVYGRCARLADFTGERSRYRSAAKVRELYGDVPENTVNPGAEYADQSDLYALQKEAVARGAKHLFIIWFDGMDWDSTRAAAIAKSGSVYDSGPGAGLLFQTPSISGVPLQFGAVVTSPTHDLNTPDVSHQTVVIPANSLLGGYDARLAGADPWDRPLVPGYLKGQSANDDDRRAVLAAGGRLHAYTDSSTSAGEVATGRKSYNNGINVGDQGAFHPTLFADLQALGWKVGTVTSVPFCHASPAAMYAHNVNRDDYQDLARDMLGLSSVTQSEHKEPVHAGLDLVIGTGFGMERPLDRLSRAQGANAAQGNEYLAPADRQAIDINNGGKYVVAETTAGRSGSEVLDRAAEIAAAKDLRLFGLFGSAKLSHLPYRTADGRFDPAPGLSGKAESYTPEELREQPTLADMARDALAVLAKDPTRPFALFIEAGDVDFALHDNNLDNAVGAIQSGEAAMQVVLDWIEKQNAWDDSVVIVTADHGHFLVIDDPKALISKP